MWNFIRVCSLRLFDRLRNQACGNPFADFAISKPKFDIKQTSQGEVHQARPDGGCRIYKGIKQTLSQKA
ncbi:MAG TPA: hypothetical protein VF571_20815 [Pyrinomonadaceae bacterium]|jgi:hypothetical protein